MAKLDITKIDTKPTYKKKIAEATAEDNYPEQWEQMTIPGVEEPKADPLDSMIDDLLGFNTQEKQEEQKQPLAQEVQESEQTRKIYKDRKTYTDDETAEALAYMKTQGRKGVKLPRINTAFTPENYYYVKVMAGVTGTSATDFVNTCIQEHREAHKELFEKAKAIKASL